MMLLFSIAYDLLWFLPFFRSVDCIYCKFNPSVNVQSYDTAFAEMNWYLLHVSFLLVLCITNGQCTWVWRILHRVPQKAVNFILNVNVNRCGQQ
jgi:hypothetical protein